MFYHLPFIEYTKNRTSLVLSLPFTTAREWASVVIRSTILTVGLHVYQSACIVTTVWQHCQTLYYAARPDMIATICFWQNSTQFFCTVSLCRTKIMILKDNLKKWRGPQKGWRTQNEVVVLATVGLWHYSSRFVLYVRQKLTILKDDLRN